MISPRDRMTLALVGFGPVGILAMLAILAGNLIFVPLSAILVLMWAQRTEMPLRALGFTPPVSWAGTIAVGITVGVAFKILMKSVVMPLLGADPINQTYHFLVGNAAALPSMLYAGIVGAGFGEEVVFRGYLFERFGRLTGRGRWATGAIVLATSALFGMAHYADQGIPGAQQATIAGLVFGTIFAVTGRIWTVMVAHAAFDITAVFIIYWNLESDVAHLVW